MKELETAPVPIVCSSRGPSYTTVTYMQSLAGSLAVGSVSVSSYESRLADSVSFLLVSLTSLTPTTLSPPPFLQDSLSSV